MGRYANYFKIGYTPAEFVLEFGQLFPESGQSTPDLHTRIISSPPYMKALIGTLTDSVEQFEAEFGRILELEPDEDGRS
jgi:hypothetical protein